jgi:hypothetical protein
MVTGLVQQRDNFVLSRSEGERKTSCGSITLEADTGVDGKRSRRPPGVPARSAESLLLPWRVRPT